MNIREYRSSSERQSEYLDACFGVGKYKGTMKQGVRRLVLGGGAGFGGKSHTQRTGVVEAAMRLSQAGVRRPRQILLCKTMTDLQERHISELGKDTHAVTGEPNGIDAFGKLSMTKFGYYELKFSGEYEGLGVVEFRHGGNLERRRGVQYEAIWPDEFTQFLREDFDAMLYMLRSSQDVPFLLFGAATNPDGPGNSYIKKLWIDRDFAGEPKGLHPDEFFFVPFFVHDNPRAGDDAVNMLLSQSEALVKSRFYGEWDLLSGSRFSSYNSRFNSFSWEDFVNFYAEGTKMTPMDILMFPGLFTIYVSFDYGTSKESASAYYFHAVDAEQNIWTFGELWLVGQALPTQARSILEHEGRLSERIELRLCDPALLGGGDYTGKSRITSFMEEGVVFHPANNSRVEGWDAMDTALYWEADGTGKLTRPPKWRIHEHCREGHAFLRNAPRSDVDPEDVDRKFKRDHAGDAMRYGISHIIAPPSKNVRKELENTHDVNNGYTHSESPVWANF